MSKSSDITLISVVLFICLILTVFSDVPQIGIVIMLAFIWAALTKILTQMENKDV